MVGTELERTFLQASAHLVPVLLTLKTPGWRALPVDTGVEPARVHTDWHWVQCSLPRLSPPQHQWASCSQHLAAPLLHDPGPHACARATIATTSITKKLSLIITATCTA